jgi:pyridoxine kinase
MARILAISSQVARGTVGLSIIVPALQALGHDVIALPTVILSNHPGHPHVAGTRIEPAVLHNMLDSLDANGWLADFDAVLTGYLPTVEHVTFAMEAVRRVQKLRQTAIYICDPVMGDDPKGLYIDRSAAEAIRDQLIPLAQHITPNRFELSFLLRREVGSDGPFQLQGSDVPAIFATSIPSHKPGETRNIAVDMFRQYEVRIPLRSHAPNGTGDLYSALIVAALLLTPYRRATYDGGRSHQKNFSRTLALATAGVDQTLLGSAQSDQLLIRALPRKSLFKASIERPLQHLSAIRRWPVEMKMLDIIL